MNVQSNGTLVGTQPIINFIGPTVGNDGGNNRVNITVYTPVGVAQSGAEAVTADQVILSTDIPTTGRWIINWSVEFFIAILTVGIKGYVHVQVDGNDEAIAETPSATGTYTLSGLIVINTGGLVDVTIFANNGGQVSPMTVRRGRISYVRSE